MKEFCYPAKITHHNDDGEYYTIDFSDFTYCFSDGETLEETLKNGKEALTGILKCMIEADEKIPTPSKLTDKDIYYISPDKSVIFALELKMIRLAKGITQKEIADMLGIKYQAYQKYENPAKANPTLKTIEKLERVLQVNLI